MVSSENIIIILLIVIILLAIFFVGVLTFVGIKFLKLQEKQSTLVKAPPSKNTEKNDAMEHSQVGPVSTSICVDHPQELSFNICAISNEPYCQECIIKHEEIWVAKKHLDILLQANWKEIYNFEVDESSDVACRVRSIKKSLWQDESIPFLIQGHFKIDVQDDKIHSFMMIKAREEDVDRVKKELSFIKFIS